ncbi:hypothetical protein JNB88_23585 [Rhizobium cauense]|uniref:hypothetical protein n=1 Tax=Rhizobium cauense TaxID=1166683 RepID=UPI001C6EFBA4|nr:hypothetical protein [Rhizobium cauense]MBW9116619.1 hypothetical protein [Rhizobium cauense]
MDKAKLRPLTQEVILASLQALADEAEMQGNRAAAVLALKVASRIEACTLIRIEAERKNATVH